MSHHVNIRPNRHAPCCPRWGKNTSSIPMGNDLCVSSSPTVVEQHCHHSDTIDSRKLQSAPYQPSLQEQRHVPWSQTPLELHDVWPGHVFMEVRAWPQSPLVPSLPYPSLDEYTSLFAVIHVHAPVNGSHTPRFEHWSSSLVPLIETCLAPLASPTYSGFVAPFYFC